MFLKTSVRGDPNIGLYGFATDKYAFFGANPEKKVKEILGVKIVTSTTMHTDFAGMFAAGNSSGIVVPGILEEYELPRLRRHFRDVLVLETNYTALGNLILMNDAGIVLSPLLRKHKAAVERFFGLNAETATIAGINLVGSVAIATNKGCLAHPKIREKEAAIVEKTLGVQLNVGTVNFGSRFVKAGVIANSSGFLASKSTSGSELGRINEALGFLKA
ncbi:MAG: translation initiation factor IF-6 [Candidatus Aenigmarchaeota archaeon]|nr:translation initiation factor IF-6 [Candidatus Aenigmarchaeota archaeon]